MTNPASSQEFSQTLDQVSQKLQESKLPALSDQKMDFANWLKQFIENLLSGLFPNGPMKISEDSIHLFFTILLGFLLILVIYFVYHQLSKKANQAYSPALKRAPATFQLPKDELVDLLNQGFLQKALRLRWKIFLLSLHQNPSITPLEFEQKFKVLNSNPAHQVNSLYFYMFKNPPESSSYLDIDSALNRLTERLAQKGTAS